MFKVERLSKYFPGLAQTQTASILANHAEIVQSIEAVVYQR
jgi:hypothetical protein